MVFLTREERIRRRKLIRYRFRALVRRVFNNWQWLSEYEDQQLGDDVQKNIAIIMHRPIHKMKGMLTIHDRRILMKIPRSRTEAEKNELFELFKGLSCFEKFQMHTLKQLTSVVELHFFDKNRMILREGYRPECMYFIVTGEILVSRKLFSKDDNQICDRPLNIITAGDCFGHVAVIYEKIRNSTCTSHTPVELLCVHKEDFDKILKENMQRKLEDIKKAIKRFEYFKNFTDEKIDEACVISKIEEFKPHQIIFSQFDLLNFSFFVLSGNCVILQCLKIRPNKYTGKIELVVAKKKDPLELAKMPVKDIRKSFIDVDQDEDVMHKFVQVGTFSCGGVFGVGEDIENRVIIAKSIVQCLMVPRHWLFQKAQNIGNVWQRIKLFNNSLIPSQQKLFVQYLDNQKWKKFKKKTIDQVKSELRIGASETQDYNIPVICRIQNQK